MELVRDIALAVAICSSSGLWQTDACVMAQAETLTETVNGQAAADQAESQAIDADGASQRLVIVVRGTDGADEYGRLFDTWCDRLLKAAERGRCRSVLIGGKEGGSNATIPGETDRERLHQVLHEFTSTTAPGTELWVVLIGHGTFDGRAAHFNLNGPDITAEDLRDWLPPPSTGDRPDRSARPVVVVNCSSCSGPFLQILSRDDRVVITATRSGSELNFARFGEHFTRAIGNAAFDLDKDGQTSLLEAFLAAARGTEQFYESEGRLATEHALLDDNGDQKGIPPDWFRGVRMVKQVEGNAAPDGRRAHQLLLVRSPADDRLPETLRLERDKIELQVLSLRERRSDFANEDAYYAVLEPLLIRLAEVYAAADSASE